jgi:4-hydroxybenzoate polyprenyltransferase
MHSIFKHTLWHPSSFMAFWNALCIWGKAARLHRPVGILLLSIPCVWGHILAHGKLVWGELLLLALGAIWTRSFGCIYNDWVDQGFDAQVARTRHRPFAHGQKLPFFKSMVLCLGIFPAIVFIFLLPAAAIAWAIAGGTGSMIYPFLKRYSYFPQVFLGFLFSLGVFLAPALAQVPLSRPFFLLYAAGILWTIEYDTVYGYQDYEDDKRLGLHSLPLLLGFKKGKFVLYMLQGTRYILLDMVVPSFGVFSFLPILPLYALNLQSPTSCGRFFSWVPLEGLLITLWMLYHVK